MAKYDFFIAGRWRNKDVVNEVLQAVRAAGYSAYCFIENDYAGEKVQFQMEGDPEQFMSEVEQLSPDDTLVWKIFHRDMDAERESTNFLLVLPAGISGHIEAGVAYGMGKHCYTVGHIAKTETLYGIFEGMFPTIDDLREWLAKR